MLTAYRAALPGVTLLLSIVAFSLALCCLLAGTSPSTLPNMQLYTLNTSRIGGTMQENLGLPPPDPSFDLSNLLPRDITDKITSVQNAVEKKGDSIAENIKDPAVAIKNLKSNITDTVNEGKQALESASAKLKSAAKNATAQIVSTFINETISTLQIQDFYLAHLLTFCAGTYTGNNHNGKANITYCSNHQPKHSSNTTNSTQSGRVDDAFTFIENMNLPDPASFAMKAITTISKIIAAIYILGITAIVFLVITSSILIPASLTSVNKGSLLRWASLAFSLGAFMCLLLGTILVHFLSKKICGFFAEHPGIGVEAEVGSTWRGCSIAATVFMGLAVGLALLDVCIGHVMKRGQDKVMGMVEGKLPFGFGKRTKVDKEYENDRM